MVAGNRAENSAAEDMLYCSLESVKECLVAVPGRDAWRTRRPAGAGHNLGDESLTVQICVSSKSLEEQWMLSEMC